MIKERFKEIIEEFKNLWEEPKPKLPREFKQGDYVVGVNNSYLRGTWAYIPICLDDPIACTELKKGKYGHTSLSDFRHPTLKDCETWTKTYTGDIKRALEMLERVQQCIKQINEFNSESDFGESEATRDN